jgi:hypothetical protein
MWGEQSTLYLGRFTPAKKPVYLNVGWDVWLRIGKMTG